MGFFHPPSSLVVGVLGEEEEVGCIGWVGGWVGWRRRRGFECAAVVGRWVGGGGRGGSNALL